MSSPARQKLPPTTLYATLGLQYLRAKFMSFTAIARSIDTAAYFLINNKNNYMNYFNYCLKFQILIGHIKPKNIDRSFNSLNYGVLGFYEAFI